MGRVVAVLVSLALLAGCTSGLAPQHTSHSAVPLVTSQTWPAPDPQFTPGALTVGCTYPRPQSERNVTLATKRKVAKLYRIQIPESEWGQKLEFDHLIPFALCGSNGAANIWPEPKDGAPESAFIHNRKDQLEQKVIQWVQNDPSRLGTAQRMFMQDDWRALWCLVVHTPDVDCG